VSAQALDRIYRALPRIACKGLCHEACGPIAGADGEIERLERVAGKPLSVRPDGQCSMLTAEGRCSVYAARPLICRLFGVAGGLECPHGCKPDRMLSKREAYDGSWCTLMCTGLDAYHHFSTSPK